MSEQIPNNLLMFQAALSNCFHDVAQCVRSTFDVNGKIFYFSNKPQESESPTSVPFVNCHKILQGYINLKSMEVEEILRSLHSEKMCFLWVIGQGISNHINLDPGTMNYLLSKHRPQIDILSILNPYKYSCLTQLKRMWNTLHSSNARLCLSLLELHMSKSNLLESSTPYEEEFLEIFSTLKQSVVKKLHKTMSENLLNALDEDLKDLIAEECVLEGMKKVAELSDETTTPPNIELWRPPGDVRLHLRSLDARKMEKECENLEMYIRVTEKENETLMDRVMKERKSIQCIGDHMKQLSSMPFKLAELENIVRSNQEYAETLQDES